MTCFSFVVHVGQRSINPFFSNRMNKIVFYKMPIDNHMGQSQ